MSPGTSFRALVAAGPVACVGAYDAMSARLVDASGAKAMYVSGFAAAAAAFGYPDLGLVSQTEMAEHLRRICRCTRLPVIADADTGFGGTLNAARTVELWEDAGAAGLHLEDQVFPKRCGHIAGKNVISAADMVAKLRAALAARRDPDFFVIARTDAVAVTGLDDAIERCLRYAEAGADALFVDAPESEAQLVAIERALRGSGKPLLFNSARTGKSPILTEARLAELGYRIVIYPIEALLASHRAVQSALAAIVAAGTTDAIADQMSSFHDINALVDLPGFVRREAGLPPG